EVDEFLQSIARKNELEYARSREYLEKNKKKILSSYEELKSKFFDIQKQILKEKERYIFAYNNDKCICGGNIKYIESHGFYGCDNYSKNERHFNFIGKEHLVEHYTRDRHINTNGWIVSIKDMSGLQKSIRNSSIFKFLIDNGKDDITLLFEGKSSEDQLNKFKNANKRAKGFEKEAEEFLRSKYKNVYPQQAFKYKKYGSSEKYAILDFLVTTDEKYIIYECKLDSVYEDEIQKQNYIDIVSFLMKEKGNNKQLEFKYLIKGDKWKI